MRRIALLGLLCAAAAASCFGQQWEFGGMGGASFLNTVNVSSPLGSATAGFQRGAMLGAFVGQNLHPHISGEIRYAYLQGNLNIASKGVNGPFSGNAHVVHYDVILHTNRKGSHMQAFVAVGGGVKFFRGTGKEADSQPNDQFGYVTKAQQLKPMGDVGVGLRFSVSQHIILRTEVRDYITAFPTQLITPAPNAKFGGILQDLVPMVTLSYEK